MARSGHTGYAEALLHHYDQPVRLRTVRGVVRRHFPAGLTGCDVLDIGCGTGDFIQLSLGEGARHVVGVDVSPQVLAKAAARFQGNPRVVLGQGTVLEQVSSGQDQYDLITSVTVLQHHVEDTQLIAALTTLRTALKPIGKIIVLELAPPHEVEDQQYSCGVLYLVERPPKAWRSAFTAAGLRVVDEPVMPQFGIACLRGLSRLVGLIYNPRQTGDDAGEGNPATPEPAMVQPLSLKRRVLRAGLALARRFILLLCYPLDHWLRFPLPPIRFRTYRIFVLEKK